MKKAITVAMCVFCMAFILCGCCGFMDMGAILDSGPSEQMYIDCAKQIMKERLKDPSSMSVNEAYLYEKDDYNNGIVYLDFSCKNGLGGATRYKVYVCVQHLDSDGNFKVSTTADYLEVDNAEYEPAYNAFKKINGWGEPDS